MGVGTEGEAMTSWDREFDVVVVGFGGAGSAAALEARSEGADVLVIDRFAGGGATARSGGVVYAGGGSTLQREAGYADNPGEMCNYLRLEVGDAVDEATLRCFCEQSLAQLHWLEGLGVPFPPSAVAPRKTSYPEDTSTLYFSGNELAAPYRQSARPAPRGHRTAGTGNTGHVLFEHLRAATVASGVEIREYCQARRLITGARGEVEGVEVLGFDAPRFWRRLHVLLFELGSWGGLFSRSLVAFCRRHIAALEERYGRTSRIRARGGVILCAGGFAFNAELMNEHAGWFRRARLLGTLGDDGSGIALGQSVGAAVGEMSNCSAWRFINPPVAFTQGVLVDQSGERICNEEYYGGTLGQRMATRDGGRGFLIIDADLWNKARAEVREGEMVHFQRISALMNLYLNRKKAGSLAELGVRCGMPAAALETTLEKYNADARQGGSDLAGKSAELLQPLRTPPFYAIDCSLDSALFPAPCITLGGLCVEGRTGRVLCTDGSPIEGLYAAGRNAVGVSSRSYMSGLAIADCFFSGRNAGRNAARSLR
jgi:3-oxo-5alpha-steroid 4-dehydrogenase